MNKPMSIIPTAIFAACLSLLLAACGGGGSSSAGGETNGTLNLSLTDAPIDSASEVVVRFGGVELQHSESDRLMFYLADTAGDCDVVDTPDTDNPCAIDLTEYQGVDKVTILDRVTVPVGEYSWLRLALNDNPGHIVIDGAQYDLRVPSGAQTGLKLHGGFTVAAGSLTSYTIDFNLRKSVHLPMIGRDEYTLRPTLRIMDESPVGTLAGNIGDDLILTGASDGGVCVGALYVFDKSSGTASTDDIDGNDADGSDPITTVMVPDDGVNDYTVGYLTEGNYLIAFTCDSELDEPDADNPTVTFLSTAEVSIQANAVTEQDLPL